MISGSCLQKTSQGNSLTMLMVSDQELGANLRGESVCNFTVLLFSPSGLFLVGPLWP